MGLPRTRGLAGTLGPDCLNCACSMVAAAMSELPPQPLVAVRSSTDGFVATVDQETVRVTVCSLRCGGARGGGSR
jgi:hypothetical protein